MSTLTTEDTAIHDEQEEELVKKDSNGNYEVIVPVLPPMEEDEDADEGQGQDGGEEDAAKEKESESSIDP